MGICRVGQSADGDAEGLSLASKVCDPVQRDGRGTGFAAGYGWALEARVAGCGCVSATREFRFCFFCFWLCLRDQFGHSRSREIPARGGESMERATVSYLRGWPAGVCPAGGRCSWGLQGGIELCFRYGGVSACRLR